MTEKGSRAPEVLQFGERRSLFWDGLRKQNLADDLSPDLLGLIEENDEFSWVLPVRSDPMGPRFSTKNIIVRATTAGEAATYLTRKLGDQYDTSSFGQDPERSIIIIYSEFHNETVFAYHAESGQRELPAVSGQDGEDLRGMAAEADKRISDAEISWRQEMNEID
jgi:hypothetical protein